MCNIQDAQADNIIITKYYPFMKRAIFQSVSDTLKKTTSSWRRKKMYILVESRKYDSRKYTCYIHNYVLKEILLFFHKIVH